LKSNSVLIADFSSFTSSFLLNFGAFILDRAGDFSLKGDYCSLLVITVLKFSVVAAYVFLKDMLPILVYRLLGETMA